MKHLAKYNNLEDYRYDYSIGKLPRPHVVLVDGYGVIYEPAYMPTPDYDSPLYIEALSNQTVGFSNAYEYSMDGIEWLSGISSTSISVTAGNRVYFRASGLSASSSSGIGKFTSSGFCNIGGNIMSMLYGADYVGKSTITQNYACYRIFDGLSGLRSAASLALPATKLAPYCYQYMFQGCTSLVNAPALPATKLATKCYYNMFQGCKSLVNAPALPATTLATQCYGYMFQGCTSLVNAPALPATTLQQECYDNMFQGCTSLVNAPALPATKLATKCYYNMFLYCTSLVNAPVLPATTLQQECYKQMFKGCTGLVNAPVLPATTLATKCYEYMFQDCTSLVNAPVLPATTVGGWSYQYMFKGCTNLRYIKAMFLTLSKSYLTDWVSGVSAEGTFVKNSAATWADTFGTNAIPEGWTVETADA